MPKHELSWLIRNTKGQYWQIGMWVNRPQDATKYKTEDTAYTVIGTQPRRFYKCDVVPCDQPIHPAAIEETPWEFPHAEVAAYEAAQKAHRSRS